MRRAIAASVAVLALASQAAAENVRGTKVTDAVFASWLEQAVPLGKCGLPPGLGHDPFAIRMTCGDLCPWQPLPDAILLSSHVDCARLVDAMDGR